MAPIILYDLYFKPVYSGILDGPFWAPNPWKTRMSLLHKGVDFVTQPVTMADLKALAKKHGKERILSPTIELPSGELISDSWKIAEWLDITYPDAPSLFLPSSPTPVRQDSPEMDVAKSFAFIFANGFGSSDAQWSTFFELSAEALARLCILGTPKTQTRFVIVDGVFERGWFQSDAKLGMQDGWKFLTSTPQETLVSRAKASLLPLEALLTDRGHSFLASKDQPGFVDYVAYGRYMMMRVAVPQLCEEIWDEKKAIEEWRIKLEKKFWEGEQGLEKMLARIGA
ncbi:BQ2448_2850 [Microbotryum intermedium]|uniref:BQ2448_2850 protein n=1 Tax=Microbotryum intermedium TaxID=269621 RepID=A0A238FBN6_9BASI|nr:BQ2448_2850 [Microbotryum intermedium]